MKLHWKKNKGILSLLFPKKLKVEVVHDVMDGCRKNKVYLIEDSFHSKHLLNPVF
jgi:hypothetical protein